MGKDEKKEERIRKTAAGRKDDSGCSWCSPLRIERADSAADARLCLQIQ